MDQPNPSSGQRASSLPDWSRISRRAPRVTRTRPSPEPVRSKNISPAIRKGLQIRQLPAWPDQIASGAAPFRRHRSGAPHRPTGSHASRPCCRSCRHALRADRPAAVHRRRSSVDIAVTQFVGFAGQGLVAGSQRQRLMVALETLGKHQLVVGGKVHAGQSPRANWRLGNCRPSGATRMAIQAQESKAHRSRRARNSGRRPGALNHQPKGCPFRFRSASYWKMRPRPA